MTDNFYIEDLILSIREETTMERYYPLIPFKSGMISVMKEANITFRNEISADIIEKLSGMYGNDIARLFSRFIHIYDFNKTKLREIRQYAGTEQYDALAALLRLPGVRILRAQLYCNSGVTLKILAEKSAEEIRDMVREYIERENRSEIVPLPKEVNCHREVAKMILHADGSYVADRRI